MCLMVFSSPTKGKKRGRLFVEPRRFGDLEIGFQGFEQLGADDQSILLALSAQLGIDGLMIDDDPPGPIVNNCVLILGSTKTTVHRWPASAPAYEAF